MARKYSWILVLGHYMFLEAHSFLRQASLSKNCSRLGTDYVRQMEVIVYIFCENSCSSILARLRC